MYGMFLKHLGVLRGYAEENIPCKVVVEWPQGNACFNAWYTNQNDQGINELSLLLSAAS